MTVAGYRWLIAEGFAPERVVIAGDSAGGGLTMATLLKALRRRRGDARRRGADLADVGSRGDGRIDDVVLFYATDDSPARWRWRSSSCSSATATAIDPYAAPLHGDLAGLPPLLIQVGDAEVLLDDAVRLADNAFAEAGVDVTLEVWPEMIHVFQGVCRLRARGRRGDHAHRRLLPSQARPRLSANIGRVSPGRHRTPRRDRRCRARAERATARDPPTRRRLPSSRAPNSPPPTMSTTRRGATIAYERAQAIALAATSDDRCRSAVEPVRYAARRRVAGVHLSAATRSDVSASRRCPRPEPDRCAPQISPARGFRSEA